MSKSLDSRNKYEKHNDSGEGERAASQTELVDIRRGGMYNGRAGHGDTYKSSNQGIVVEKDVTKIHETV